MDPVKILPTEVFEKVLSYLNLKELLSCCLVSQKWNIAANNDGLWKKFCVRGWVDCSCLKEYVNKVKFLKSDEKDAFLNMGEWKKILVLKNRLKWNWRTGKSTDFTFSPVENDSKVSSVFSDYQTTLAFGLDNGVLRLFDLQEEGKLIATKECVLDTPVTQVLILNEYVFVMQNCLFQQFKLCEDSHLELCSVKIINESLIVNVDIPTLMLLDRKDRIVVINENRADTIYHFHGNYLVFASKYSQIVNVYDLKYDFLEPDTTFKLSTDLTNSFIFNVHVNEDILYVLISDFQKISIQAYSLKSKALLFAEKITDNFQLGSKECSVDSNTLYIVIKFDLNAFFLLRRDTGKVIMDGEGVILLDANSNPKLIGLMLEYVSFQIMDPNLGECFCVTLDEMPVAVYSDVIVTTCVEFNSDCIGTTDVEFWSIRDGMEVVSSLKFPTTSNIILLHKDSTKLVFYVSPKCCVVRNFLV